MVIIVKNGRGGRNGSAAATQYSRGRRESLDNPATGTL